MDGSVMARRIEEHLITTTEVRIVLVSTIQEVISGRVGAVLAVGTTKRENFELDLEDGILEIIRDLSTGLMKIEGAILQGKEGMSLKEEGQTNDACMREMNGLQRVI